MLSIFFSKKWSLLLLVLGFWCFSVKSNFKGLSNAFDEDAFKGSFSCSVNKETDKLSLSFDLEMVNAEDILPEDLSVLKNNVALNSNSLETIENFMKNLIDMPESQKKNAKILSENFIQNCGNFNLTKNNIQKLECFKKDHRSFSCKRPEFTLSHDAEEKSMFF